jgi:hypothetical protein
MKLISPKSCVISFKLETDEKILQEKVYGSFEKYNVDMIVANILEKRRYLIQLFINDRSAK